MTLDLGSQFVIPTRRRFADASCAVPPGVERSMPQTRPPSRGQLVPAATGPDNRLTIIEIRGERVVLDADLAAIFGVETRVFNQAFKRNQERFPDTWAFELTQPEFDDLKSRSVIS